MPKRISKPKRPKRPTDPNEWARQMVDESTAEPKSPPSPAADPTPNQVSEFMAAMGRRGGLIGGKRRLVTMTPEKRREVALKAAQARWAKAPPKSKPIERFAEGDIVEYVDAKTGETKYGRITKMYGSDAILRVISKEQAGPNPKRITPRLPG
jgi:hypothetical protein